MFWGLGPTGEQCCEPLNGGILLALPRSSTRHQDQQGQTGAQAPACRCLSQPGDPPAGGLLCTARLSPLSGASLSPAAWQGVLGLSTPAFLG